MEGWAVREFGGGEGYRGVGEHPQRRREALGEAAAKRPQRHLDFDNAAPQEPVDHRSCGLYI